MTPEREERLVVALERGATGLLRLAAALEADSRPGGRLEPPPDASWITTEPVGGQSSPWAGVAAFGLLLAAVLAGIVLLTS